MSLKPGRANTFATFMLWTKLPTPLFRPLYKQQMMAGFWFERGDPGYVRSGFRRVFCNVFFRSYFENIQGT